MPQHKKQSSSHSDRECDLIRTVKILFELPNAQFLHSGDRNLGPDAFLKCVDNQAFHICALDKELAALLHKNWAKKAEVQKQMGNTALSAEIAAVANMLSQWEPGVRWHSITIQSRECMYFLVVDLQIGKILAVYKHVAASPLRFHQQINQ